jgi:hypothetical protein
MKSTFTCRLASVIRLLRSRSAQRLFPAGLPVEAGGSRIQLGCCLKMRAGQGPMTRTHFGRFILMAFGVG